MVGCGSWQPAHPPPANSTNHSGRLHFSLSTPSHSPRFIGRPSATSHSPGRAGQTSLGNPWPPRPAQQPRRLCRRSRRIRPLAPASYRQSLPAAGWAKQCTLPKPRRTPQPDNQRVGNQTDHPGGSSLSSKRLWRRKAIRLALALAFGVGRLAQSDQSHSAEPGEPGMQARACANQRGRERAHEYNTIDSHQGVGGDDTCEACECELRGRYDAERIEVRGAQQRIDVATSCRVTGGRWAAAQDAPWHTNVSGTIQSAIACAGPMPTQFKSQSHTTAIKVDLSLIQLVAAAPRQRACACLWRPRGWRGGQTGPLELADRQDVACSLGRDAKDSCPFWGRSRPSRRATRRCSLRPGVAHGLIASFWASSCRRYAWQVVEGLCGQQDRTRPTVGGVRRPRGHGCWAFSRQHATQVTAGKVPRSLIVERAVLWWIYHLRASLTR